MGVEFVLQAGSKRLLMRRGKWRSCLWQRIFKSNLSLASVLNLAQIPQENGIFFHQDYFVCLLHNFFSNFKMFWKVVHFNFCLHTHIPKSHNAIEQPGMQLPFFTCSWQRCPAYKSNLSRKSEFGSQFLRLQSIILGKAERQGCGQCWPSVLEKQWRIRAFTSSFYPCYLVQAPGGGTIHSGCVFPSQLTW